MKITFTNLGALVIILAFVHLIVIFKSLKSNCKSKDVFSTLIVSIAMFGSTFVITRDYFSQNMIVSIILSTLWMLYCILALTDIFIKIKMLLSYK